MGTPIQNVILGAIAAVTSGNKFEMIENLIPQRLEDGKLINFKGRVIGTHDGEDQIFTEEGLEAPARMTVAFIKKVTDPVADAILGETKEESKASEKTVNADKNAPTGEIKDETRQGRLIIDLLEEGKFKKAKKVLKGLDKVHPRYKEFKKEIKKGLENG